MTKPEIKYFSSQTVFNAALNKVDLWKEPTEKDEDGESLIFEIKIEAHNEVYTVTCASEGGGAGSAHFWTLTSGSELDPRTMIPMAAALLMQMGNW